MSFEPRVLVVDDNEAMLGCVATVLTPECVIVGAAKDGRAALRVAGSVHPDVIVLGGGMSNAGRLYTEVPRLWGRYVFSDQVATRLERHVHGDSSGVRGAAWLWERK